MTILSKHTSQEELDAELQRAFEAEDIDMILRLGKRGADWRTLEGVDLDDLVHSRGQDGIDAFFVEKVEKLVEVLLDIGVDPNIFAPGTQTILAKPEAELKVLDKLFSKGGTPRPGALIHVMEVRNLKAMDVFVRHGVEIKDYHLIIAGACQDTPEIAQILQGGPEKAQKRYEEEQAEEARLYAEKLERVARLREREAEGIFPEGVTLQDLREVKEGRGSLDMIIGTDISRQATRSGLEEAAIYFSFDKVVELSLASPEDRLTFEDLTKEGNVMLYGAKRSIFDLLRHNGTAHFVFDYRLWIGRKEQLMQLYDQLLVDSIWASDKYLTPYMDIDIDDVLNKIDAYTDRFHKQARLNLREKMRPLRSRTKPRPG